MKPTRFVLIAACASALTGCAATVPTELSKAREAYRRASTGAAATVAPAELHIAGNALATAEKSFVDNRDSYHTKDLAYVATRKAQVAEATASIALEKKTQTKANADFAAAQTRIVASTKEDLTRSRSDLANSERVGAAAADKLSVEQKARADADKRAADAQAALAKLAAVKEEPRGMVITLSGSVLFASNQSTLLPAARERLDEVAAVLLTTRERNLTIEGHTDSQGSDSFNLDLSQRRADAVRAYLLQRGYGADLVTARGMGEGQAVSDNGNAEGRANNRRVEIIIERDHATAAN